MSSKNYILLFVAILLAQFSMAQSQTQSIQGIVTDGSQPMENVNIHIKDTPDGVKTNAEGRYTINAEEGQILVYSYVGKKSVEIMVEDVTRYLNIQMYDRVEELEEVTVTRRGKKSQKELFEEYSTNKKLIKTSFGILDKEKTGYAMRIIEGDRLTRAGQDFVDGLQSWIPSAQVFRPGSFRPGGGSRLGRIRRPTDLSIPIVYLPRASRSANPVPAAYEVDGVVYTEAPIFISVNNIERMAVIESLAGVARYGSLGAGGMVIINTKTGNFSKTEPGTNLPYDQAKLRDNFVAPGDIVANQKLAVPSYLEQLSITNTLTEAQGTFDNLEKSYANSPYFYLDALTYFNDQWGKEGKSDEIYGLIKRKFSMDPTILKALAYQMEAMGENKKAHEIYKDIFILRPHYAQSYLDLANSYSRIGDVEYAATLFARYNYLVKESYFSLSKSFSPIIDREFGNLLNQHGNVFKGNSAIVQVSEDDFKGSRLLLEWNNTEAEFELQFVNPNGQYYTWKHSINENPERIMEEKKLGYTCEEYLIYEPSEGTWRVNIKYLGNKSLTPTYIKATIVNGYNTPEQTSTVKVLPLREKGVNINMLSIVNSKVVSVN
nr:carboxypeptidase-like regulatory domain-containing protein [Allomuricauda sp.]